MASVGTDTQSITVLEALVQHFLGVTRRAPAGVTYTSGGKSAQPALDNLILSITDWERHAPQPTTY